MRVGERPPEALVVHVLRREEVAELGCPVGGEGRVRDGIGGWGIVVVVVLLLVVVDVGGGGGLRCVLVLLLGWSVSRSVGRFI